MGYIVGTGGVDALNWAMLKKKLFEFFRVDGVVSGLLTRGEALDEMTRTEMESALGYELKDVRIHETKQAGELARWLEAEAFTAGADVFTAEGKLKTPIRESRGLLVHELTHVIQQTHPRPVLRPSDNVGRESPRTPGGSRLSRIAGNAEPPGPELQLAPIGAFQAGGSSVAEAMETMARTVEQAASREERDLNRSQGPTAGAKEIADIVYRLMQQELLLERDRARR